MTRFILIFIVGLLSLCSCTKIDDIRVHGMTNFKVSELSAEGVSGEVALVVTNQGSKVTLSDTQIELFLANASTPFMTIRPEKIVLPKGDEQTIRIPFNVQLKGGVLGAIALPNILNKQKDKINISVRTKVKNGWASKKINVEHQSMNRLMDAIGIKENIFGNFSNDTTR